MKNCPNCQQPLADDARFCPACGNAVPVAAAAAAPSFCRNCGSPMEANSKFCTECGVAVPAVAAVVIPPVVPPVTPAPAAAPAEAPKRKKRTGLLVFIWTSGIAILLVLALLVSWSFGLFGGGPFGEGGLFGTVSSQDDDDDDDDDDHNDDDHNDDDPSNPSGQTRPEDIIPLPTQPAPTVPQPKPVEIITLTVWAPRDAIESGWLSSMEAAFAEILGEHYSIRWENVAVSEADASRFVLMEGEQAADVFMFANDQLWEMVTEDALLPLSGAVLDTVQASTSETMLNTVTYDGKVYGIPYTGNTWFMYYDKSVFTEEDVKSLESMLAKDKVAFRLTNSWYTGSFYFANGCTMFGPTGNDASAGFDFGGEKATAVTNYLVDLIQHPNFVIDDDMSGLAGIQNGTVKAYFSGEWEADKVKEALGDNFACAPLPTINIGGEQKQLRAFAGSKAIGINPYSDEVELSQLLAAFLAGAEAQRQRYEVCGTVPCSPSLAGFFESGSLIRTQMDALNYTAYVQPTIPEMGLWWATASNMAYKLISGEITHENATEKTEEFNAELNSAW